jgi:hypothetical protein
VKDVRNSDITTCDPAEYTFYIQNVNCTPKTVSFSDTLPAKMKWDINSIGLDAASSDLNLSLNPQIIPGNGSNGDILQIDTLVIPEGSTLMMTATAVFDSTVVADSSYSNRATITYDQTNNYVTTTNSLESSDRQTLDPYTAVYATWQQRQDSVTMQDVYSMQTYKANSVIEVTYTINNPNDEDMTDMFLGVEFNEGFSYIDGSFQATTPDGTQGNLVAAPDADDPTMLTIAGSTTGYDGFTLPKGNTVITFKLQAPATPLDELDDSGNPTGNKQNLDIIYNVTSTMDDLCAIQAMDGLQGDKLILYSKGKMFVISNRHITSRIIR